MLRRRGGGADLVLALVLLAFAGSYGWLAFQLPERNIPGSVGLDFVPKLLAGLLVLLSALLFVRGLRGKGAEPPDSEGPGWGRAALVLGLMVAYVAALSPLGFPLATPPFLAIGMLLAGARRPTFILAMVVGVTAAIWIVFTALFAVPLPRGPLP